MCAFLKQLPPRVHKGRFCWFQSRGRHSAWNKGSLLSRLTHANETKNATHIYRGTQREYSSKPLKHRTVKRILVFKL